MPKLSLIDRAGVIYFRVMVPKDLRSVLQKDKIVKSTKTSDKRQAERVAARSHFEILDEFETVRRSLNSLPTGSVTSKLRLTHPPEEHITELPQTEATKGALVLVIDWADKTQAPKIPEPLGAVLTELITAYRDPAVRNIGDALANPALPATAPTLKPRKLRDVFDKWRASKKRPEDSERACERALIMFEKWAKHPAIDKITREMGIDFRAYLLDQNTTTKTARDRLNWLLTLLKFASQDLEWITRNPWQGLSIDSKTTKKRRPWKPDELQRLFSLPLFTAYELPTLAKAGKDAAYWVPLLGLFTGARIGELCQLQVEDIDTTAALLHIKDDADGQQLKTENAARTLPVHSELIRLGFLEFVSNRKRLGKLWSSLPLRTGKPSGYFSQWFNETRKAEPVGLDQLPDFHCFRHTVRSIMSEQGIAEPVQDRITGHAIKGSTGTKVYTHHSLDALRKAVESIQYPGLSLPRVYQAPAK